MDNPNPQNTPFAYGIRLGCGFVFGVVVAMFVGLYWFGLYWFSILLVPILIGVTFGLLSARYGDAFWEWIAGWWYWFIWW